MKFTLLPENRCGTLPRWWRRMSILLCLALSLPGLAQSDWDPVADPAAVVTSGNVRFTVLTPRMIRIEQSTTGQFEDRATLAVVNRRLPVPAFTQETADGYLTIRTSDLTLSYKIGGTINEKSRTPGILNITFDLNGKTVTWYPGKDDALNLMGTCRTLDLAWGDSHRDRLEKGLLSREGWSIIDESPTATRGDKSTTYALEKNADGFTWWSPLKDPKAYDWYFLGYGHDYKECLGDYTKIGGKVPIPPKYIMGYWYSRYYPYSDADFRQIVRDVRSYNIPMDVIIMDMDWHKSGWTGWSWNRDLIPNPVSLINFFHANGLRTALNLHPADGIGPHEDQYAAMKASLGLDASFSGTIPWAIEDYDFYKALFKNVIRPHEEEGVDFWWLDWQQTLLVNNTTLSQTFWCNHTFFEDMRLHRTDVRPVIYHRWGGLGCHRYPIGFSGDTYATWSTLAYEIPFTSTASNVCYNYWGHDLGGHQGGDNDPELYQRWLQFGVYNPIFRTHATRDDRLERRIWKYSNFTQLRETIRERYRLFPYIYTMARETYDTGVGMNRPLYYEYPEEPNAYLYEDEFMFGSDILVAPIYTPVGKDKLASRRIWLPQGLWWDVSKNELVEGGQVERQYFTTDQFPVYYKAGSVIPYFPTQRTVTTTPKDIYLKVAPGANGTGSFYEDDGDNTDYLKGQWARTTFTQQYQTGGVDLTISPRTGTYEGIPTERNYFVQFLGASQYDRDQVTINGQAASPGSVSYDESTATLTVSAAVEDFSKSIQIHVPFLESLSMAEEGGQIHFNEGSQTVSVTLPQGVSTGVFTVTTMGGQVVARQQGGSLSATLAGWPTGIYVCTLQYAGSKPHTIKIVKQ